MGIGTYVANPVLEQILNKVSLIGGNGNMADIVSSQGIYRFTKQFLSEHPEVVELQGEGTGDKIVSRIVELLPNVFITLDKHNDNYISIIAKTKTSRVVKYIKRSYVQETTYLEKYNVVIPESNGKGPFDVFSTPIVLGPGEGFSDTFISIGCFGERYEAENAMKYIKGKFSRAMLGIKKATQHNPKDTWIYVPTQDFSTASDIDWTQSIANVDKQLYAKYQLSSEEISFIEDSVPTMK